MVFFVLHVPRSEGVTGELHAYTLKMDKVPAFLSKGGWPNGAKYIVWSRPHRNHPLKFIIKLWKIVTDEFFDPKIPDIGRHIAIPVT